MYRVAVNTALMHVRKKRRKDNVFEPGFPKEEIFVDPDSETNDLAAQLHWAISQLDSSDKLIISLFLESFSYQEIADIAGISVSNVGVKINRIKSKLSSILDVKS